MIVACTYVMVPLAVVLLLTLKLRSDRHRRGGADGDRRPGDADPRGPGAADERHLRGRRGAAGAPQHAGPADERDREPRRGRHDLRRQDRDPDRRRAAAARGRGRRGGRRGGRARGAGRFAASAGDRNRTLETIAERFPGEAGRVSGEVPFSSEWKWSGPADRRRRSYVLGAPDVLEQRGRADPARRARRASSSEETAAGRRVVAFGESSEALPADPAAAPPPRADAAGPGRARRDAAPRRRRDDRLHARAGSRPEADLRRRARDRDRGRLRGRRARRRRRRSRAPTCPTTPRGWPRRRSANTIFCRIAPEQKKALVAALRESGRYTAMIGDGVNDVPALKQARLAVAMGSGAQVTKGVADVVLLEDEFSRLPRSGRRGPADRPQHPPPRPPLPDQDRLRGGADPARRRARLRLPLPPPPPDPGRLPDDRHPLLRARPGALRRAALPRPPAAGAGRLRGPGRARRRRSARSSPSSSSTPSSAARSRPAGPRRRRP